MNELMAMFDTVAVAGAVGGIVRFAIFRESLKELVYNIITGAATAYYLAHTITVLLLVSLGISALPEPLTVGMVTKNVAFLTGFSGAVALVFIQERILSQVGTWISKRTAKVSK